MIVIILFLVFSVMILDLRLLRGHKRGLFQETFVMKRSYVIGFLAPLFLLMLLSLDLLKIFAVYFLLVILPFYLIRRRRYGLALQEKSGRFHLVFDAYGVILHWIFWGVVMSVLINAYLDFFLQFSSQLAEIILSAMGSSLLLIVLVYQAAQKFSPSGFLTNVSMVKGRATWVQLVILPVIAGVIFAAVSAYLIVAREAIVQTPLSEVIAGSQSTNIFMIFLFLAICVAPAVEEIVFRGYFFHVLKQTKGMVWALVVISLSFALLHVGQYWGDWLAILMITVIGFALTGLRALSGSTISSVVMHYTYNACVSILPVVMLMSNNPAYYQYHARFPELLRREKEALLIQATKDNPGFAEAHHDLAALFFEEPSQLPRALQAINHALEIYPRDRMFLELKARILEGLGRYQQALDIRNSLLKPKKTKYLRQF